MTEQAGTMRGVVFVGDRTLEVRNFPRPTVQDDQVLVAMEASTICGSDMHYYRSEKQELGPRAGWISGHEVAGTVEEVGDSVRSLGKGDRVSVFHLFGCGFCEMCRKGYPQYCLTHDGSFAIVKGQAYNPPRSTGGFADYVLVPAAGCLKLPESLSYEDGAILGCSGVTAFQAIEKLGVSARDDVAIYGLGPVGLCALTICKALGARTVGIDLSEERMRIAEKIGADQTVRATGSDTVKTVTDFSNGGVDVALDFTGSPEAVKNAVQSVKNLGKVCLVGVGPRIGESFLSPSTFMSRGVWVTGINVSNINLWFDLVRLMTRRGFSFNAVVTHHFPLGEASDAFKLFDTQGTGKIAFRRD